MKGQHGGYTKGKPVVPPKRVISFDRDIIEDVAALSGGKFTESQVRWCLKASVAYIYHLAKYTDVMKVRIPYLGWIYMNEDRMRVRLSRLNQKERRFYLLPEDHIERDCLKSKLDKMEVLKAEGKTHPGHPWVRKFLRFWKGFSYPFTMEGLQDFQANQFKDFDDPDKAKFF